MCRISQKPLVGCYPNFKLQIRGPNQIAQKPLIEDDPNKRGSQNIKCRICQQPLVRSYPNFKLKLKMTPTEDDLKIKNVEYLNNHWSDIIQILNFSSGDQTKVYN
jgi:hypothetical protein